MAVKNAVAKDWSSWLPSFDGVTYSNFPAGDKPSGYATLKLLATDISCISLSGGESNLGSYLTIFGYGFGLQKNLSLTSGARIYLRDPLGDNAWHEVANYRSLLSSKNFAVNQVQQITCQVGSLGGSQTAGRALDIKVTVNSVDSNVLTGQCTYQPGGRFWFLNNVTGSDTTGKPDDITKPFRYPQASVGGGNSYTGIWATTTNQGDAGLRAGDTFVYRGTGTPWSDQTGFDNRQIRFRSHTGSAPSSAVGHGYIHFTRYPGPILGNAPETVVYNDPAGGGGFLCGVNSAYAQLYGMYVSISGITMTCNATSRSDSGMINFQNDADHWRVYDCEMGPWPSTLAAPNNAKSAGAAGNGDSIHVRFCNIHDISCDHAANENHGIYADGSSNGAGYNSTAINWDISYNWIKNITGGSGIQLFNQAASGAGVAFVGMSIHHNVIDTTAKYGINFADYCKQVDAYNNIVVGTAAAAFRFNTAISSAVINVTHNIAYNNNTSGQGPAQGAINNDGNFDATAVVNVQHNIIALQGGRGVTRSSNDFYTNNGTGSAIALQQNLYWDADGTVTAPAGDSSAVSGDPKWTSSSTGDYTVLAGSPVLAACTLAEKLAVAVDFFGVARPVTGTGAPGATKNDIGPTQGVGT